jgi:hypothetical protein
VKPNRSSIFTAISLVYRSDGVIPPPMVAAVLYRCAISFC